MHGYENRLRADDVKKEMCVYLRNKVVKHKDKSENQKVS